MKRPRQIGITGGIGAGKSLVCKVFNFLGVPVFDSDSRARWLMTNDPELVARIKSEFGDESYFKDGSLNRKWISQRTFGFPEKIERLNNLVHPRVGDDFERWLSLQSANTYVIKEAALLIETGSYMTLDEIIIVTAPESIRVKRILKRDPQRSESEIRDIIRSQLSESEKIRYANYVITNDETKLVVPQVFRLHEKLRKPVIMRADG